MSTPIDSLDSRIVAVLRDVVNTFNYTGDFRVGELPEDERLLEQATTKILALIKVEVIRELRDLQNQYGEFRDETLGKPIVLKAVTLYRIKDRIKQLEEEL